MGHFTRNQPEYQPTREDLAEMELYFRQLDNLPRDCDEPEYDELAEAERIAEYLRKNNLTELPF